MNGRDSVRVYIYEMSTKPSQWVSSRCCGAASSTQPLSVRHSSKTVSCAVAEVCDIETRIPLKSRKSVDNRWKQYGLPRVVAALSRRIRFMSDLRSSMAPHVLSQDSVCLLCHGTDRLNQPSDDMEGKNSVSNIRSKS